jgi:hypothetical protein
MASIFDIWRDKTATTSEQLFNDIVEQEEEETKPDTIRSAVAAAAGPAGVNPFLIEQEEVVREETPVEKYLKETVGIENPKGMTDNEKQAALNDFLEKRQSENIFAPPTAEEKQMEAEGLKFQEEETARGFQAFEQADLAKKVEQQAINQSLDAQLSQLNQQVELVNNKQKFNEIRVNRDKSLKSIEQSARAIISNKATAGTNFGKMKLQNLYAMEQEVLNQANADMERLGGMAYEKLDPDSRLVYTKLSQNPQIAPQDRIQYTAGNNLIKQTSQNLLLNVPEDKRDQVDEYLFGKKKVENGQVQYDADNEPIRITKGIAFKNQFGIYEPSVDLDTYESKLKEVGQQFSPAKAAKEIEPVKDAETTLKRANAMATNIKDMFVESGNAADDFTLEAAIAKDITTKEEVDEIKKLRKEAQIQLLTGQTFDIADIEKMSEKRAKTELNNRLTSLLENPEKETLKSIGQAGIVPTFTVENNKLVSVDSEGASKVKNQDFVIITDPKVGSQLVKIGADKISNFLDDANRYYYVDGEFTTQEPSLTEAARTRLEALGIVGPKEEEKLETPFNTLLKDAYQKKQAFQKKATTTESKKKKIEELPW